MAGVAGSYEGRVLEGSSPKYDLTKRLGDGNSMEGDVYLAKYRDLLTCAVKLVDPAGLKSKTGPQTAQQVADLLENEVRLLSVLRHSNIVRITDFGVGRILQKAGTIFGEERFYIAMHYIPGDSLDDVWSVCDGPRLLRLLHQVSEGLAYLHARGVLHMDLKPANILVERETDTVVLIDLGFGAVADLDLFYRSYREGEGWRVPLQDDQTVFVAGTEEYTPEDLRSKLYTTLRREDLRHDWFPRQDLNALSIIIDRAVSVVDLRAWPSIRDGLSLVQQRLLNPGYSAIQAEEDLRKLHPGALAPLGIPELSPVVDDGTYIAHVFGPVPATRSIWSVIEHRAFQRLRDIPQLERLSLTFVGALHTRLSHSLLCFNMARLALTYMLSTAEFRLAVNRVDAQAFLLCALLHDTGHYPLSHMFEDWRGRETGQEDQVLIDDDLFLVMLDPDDAPASHQSAAAAVRGHIGRPTLRQLIEDQFGSPVLEAVRSIWQCAHGGETARGIHRTLACLLSSAVDLDKVAYLLEDSAMTGVPYGQGVDVHGFLAALRLPIEIAGPLGGQAGRPLLTIDEKGLAAAESIIFARYGMLKRVYWQHTNRSVMAAYKFVINELIEQRRLTFAQYLEKCFWRNEVEATRFLDGEFRKLPQLRGSRRPRRYDPLPGLMDGHRDFYRRVLTVSYHWDPKLHNRLTEADEARSVAVAREAVGRVVKREIAPGEIVVDIPKSGRDLVDLTPIRVVDVAGGGRDADWNLQQASLILSRIEQETLDQVKKCRVFACPPLHNELQRSGLLARTREELATAFAEL